MNRDEIRSLIKSVIDDPGYIDTAVEILATEIQKVELPDLRQFLIDGNVPCMIRIDGCTHFGDQRAHVRIAGHTGTGFKAPDPIFAWSCSNCHQKTESSPEMRRYLLDGFARTLFAIVESIPITCKNDNRRKKTNKGMR